jgi:hypothetical protein
MFRTTRILTIASAVLAVASLAGAQATMAPAKPAAAPATTQSMKPAAKSTSAKKAAATSMSATGKIAKFDAASNTLTVTTTKGDVDFMVPATASLHEGTTTLQAASLSTMTGKSVRVQYMDNAGTKTAQSVKVTAAAPAKGSAKSATKAPASTSASPKK